MNNQTELAYKAINEKLDADTEGGILCYLCLQCQFVQGEYNGYKINVLIPHSDACYNCNDK